MATCIPSAGRSRSPSQRHPQPSVGVFAWLMMMVTFLPLAGAGFFGAKIGIPAVIGLLGLHLIYGAVLGAMYGLLGVWVPVKVHSPEEQDVAKAASLAA